MQPDCRWPGLLGDTRLQEAGRASGGQLDATPLGVRLRSPEPERTRTFFICLRFSPSSEEARKPSRAAKLSLVLTLGQAGVKLYCLTVKFTVTL